MIKIDSVTYIDLCLPVSLQVNLPMGEQIQYTCICIYLYKTHHGHHQDIQYRGRVEFNCTHFSGDLNHWMDMYKK